MHVARIELAEIVHERGRVVGHDSTTLAPQCPAHPLVLGSRGPVGKSEQTAVDSKPVAAVDVVFLRLITVPEVESLGGAEVAGLAERETLQREPQVLSCASHVV